MKPTSGRCLGFNTGSRGKRLTRSAAKIGGTTIIHPLSYSKTRPLLFLILAILGLALPLLPSARTATPPSGTLTDISGPVQYDAGPFFVANPSAQANGTPICDPPETFPCDNFTLTVSVPPGFATTHKVKVVIDDCSSPAMDLWEDKTFPGQTVNTLDPIGFVDPQTGRVFHSQLSGGTSTMVFSDDDGETWTPSQGSGQPAGVDHQTVGGGPYNPNSTPPPPPHPTYANQVYYASQDIATAFAARSDNGGLTFNPGLPVWDLTH